MIAMQESGTWSRNGLKSERSGTQKQLDYIDSFEFLSNEDYLAKEATALLTSISSKLSRNCESPYSYSHGMGNIPVLGREEEASCFRTMNFLKHQLADLQSEARSIRFSHAQEHHLNELIEQVKLIRDYLIHSNLRLVISLVKKFVTPHFTFEELYSEGVVTLMQAVEKFDFQRGFRFSTYAYRSISRALYNYCLKSQQQNTLFVEDPENIISQTVDTKEDGISASQLWRNMRERLFDLIQRLDRREQLIIRARYALAPSGKVRTFQALADKLGVSKERVRQLEQRAVMKLQSMAMEVELAG